MRILLAIDGSTFSDSAVNEVAARPWPQGSLVKVIVVVRLPFVPTEETRSIPSSEYSRIERSAMDRANATLTKASTRLNAQRPQSLVVESQVSIGDAREVILDEASAWNADLIVLGSRGLGGFRRFMLGSVALGVLSHAPCSVRIVRAMPVQDSEGAMKILLAIDGSLCGLAAAEAIAQRPWPPGSRVKIVNVAERPIVLPKVEQTLPLAVLTELHSAARAAIEKAAAYFAPLANDGITVESDILHGNPKKVILDEGEKWRADLIVLGSHGMSAIERFLLGSVSLTVATHAKCSVEVVRCIKENP